MASKNDVCVCMLEKPASRVGFCTQVGLGLIMLEKPAGVLHAGWSRSYHARETCWVSARRSLEVALSLLLPGLHFPPGSNPQSCSLEKLSYKCASLLRKIILRAPLCTGG